MRTIKHLLMACCVSGFFSAPALAQSADFIAQFNSALDRFASASNIGITYKDVEQVKDPMVGNYFAFVNTEISVPAGDVSYVVTLARTVLYVERDGTYRVHLPASAEMTMRYEGQEEPYLIRLSGAPQIWLRHDSRSSNFEIKSTPKPAPFGLADAPAFKPSLIKVGEGSESVRGLAGEITIAASSVTSNDWARIGPIGPTVLAHYIGKMCETLNTKIQPNYPGYAFKGCVWYKP